MSLLSIKEVSEKIGMSPAWIWREVRLGRFPRPRKLGAATRWVEAQVDEWIHALPERRSA